jgi:hypothetical protein
MIREKIIAKQGEKKIISKDHIMNKKKINLSLREEGSSNVVILPILSAI